MKVMWIGHGGLLFVSGKNKVLIDPYLSNSLSLSDKLFKRKVKIKKKLFKVKPNVIVLTSSHPDRTDEKTLKNFINKKTRKNKPTVLSCEEAFKKISKEACFKNANHILFEAGLEWSLGDMTLRAVKAKTDDRSAFGLVITDNEDGKKYYVASNTLYAEELFQDIPSDLYAAFIPISGTFGSMNIIDASRFARRLNAEFTVPVQFGMFDKLKAEQFVVPGRVLPRIYKIVEFNLLNLHSLFNNGLDFKFNEKKKKKKKILEIEQDDIDTITIDVPVIPADMPMEAIYQAGAIAPVGEATGTISSETGTVTESKTGTFDATKADTYDTTSTGSFDTAKTDTFDAAKTGTFDVAKTGTFDVAKTGTFDATPTTSMSTNIVDEDK